mgnify:CR=1 FL=1
MGVDKIARINVSSCDVWRRRRQFAGCDAMHTHRSRSSCLSNPNNPICRTVSPSSSPTQRALRSCKVSRSPACRGSQLVKRLLRVAFMGSRQRTGNVSANSILLGDCLKELAKLPAMSVDLVFADPPYNLQLAGPTTRASMASITTGTSSRISKPTMTSAARGSRSAAAS